MFCFVFLFIFQEHRCSRQSSPVHAEMYTHTHILSLLQLSTPCVTHRTSGSTCIWPFTCQNMSVDEIHIWHCSHKIQVRSYISAPTDLQGLFHCRVMKCAVLFLHWQTVAIMVKNHCFLNLIRSSTSPYIHITLSHLYSSCNLSLAERWQTPFRGQAAARSGRPASDTSTQMHKRQTQVVFLMWKGCNTHTGNQTETTGSALPIILSPFILSTTVRDYVHCLYIIYTKIIYTLLSICMSILCC